MKKITALLLAGLLACAALTSCGAKERYNYDLTQYMTVADYKTIEVGEDEKAADIKEQIDSILESNSEEKDRTTATEEGDKLTYLITGAKVDGEANDTLNSENNNFTVGTTKTEYEELNTLLESGLKTGEVREITVTIPESNKDEALRGKTAELTVKVTAAKYTYVPEELTDSMVTTSTNNRYTTVADYMAYLEEAVPQNLAFEAVLDATTFTGYPKKEAEAYYESYIANYEAMATQYGMTLESLAAAYGGTEIFFNSLAVQAVEQVQREMVIYHIYYTEDLTITPKMEKNVIEDLMASYDYATEKEVRDAISKESLQSTLVYEAVLTYLAENVKYVEAAETEAPETEAVTEAAE